MTIRIDVWPACGRRAVVHFLSFPLVGMGILDKYNISLVFGGAGGGTETFQPEDLSFQFAKFLTEW